MHFSTIKYLLISDFKPLNTFAPPVYRCICPTVTSLHTANIMWCDCCVHRFWLNEIIMHLLFYLKV